MLDKRYAIFHNFMDNIGGAEVVTLFLARELNARVYTTVYDKEKIKRLGFSDVDIKSIGWIPKQAPFRHQLAFFRFRRLNLGKKYDYYIISGDWAMSGAVNHKPNLWYVHSPLNELWEFKDYIKNELLSWWKKPIYEVWVKFNRFLNKRYLRHVEILVANSKNTQNRISRYYGRKSEIIHPPIDLRKYYSGESGDYWLSVNRLLKHKRIDIQLEAFKLCPEEKLVIVGSYEKGVAQFEEYKRYIERIKPGNVKILSWVADEKLKELYSNCKGLIATARDEDFGMSPVEAMACGKPVIAANEGGYKESVIDGVTGYLIKDINPKKLAMKIKRVSEEIKIDSKRYVLDSKEAAAGYDIKEFIKKIKNRIN